MSEARRGIPIGNLTSQIFANIYLNELDRFVVHTLKPKNYLRYGDDFILVETDLERLKNCRKKASEFLAASLRLKLNPKNDIILRPWNGLKFLGVVMDQEGRILNRRNQKRIKNRLNLKNAGSYYGLVKKHGSPELRQFFPYWVSELIEKEF